MNQLVEEKRCELCGSVKVYQIKSHYTPRSISQTTYGEKDKESIITISPHDGLIDRFFGREHPDAPSNELKSQPNVGRGIFCKRCEEALGRFESHCQDKLNNALVALEQSDIKVLRMGSGIKYFKTPIPSNILRVFFYSIVWRQCLEQNHSGNDSSLDKVEFERLKSILNHELHQPLNEVAKSKSFEKYPRILIFTTFHRGVDSNFNNPSPIKSNPELFYISRTICLYWKDSSISPNFGALTQVPSRFLHTEKWLFPGSDESEIGIVNEDVFEKIKTKMIIKPMSDFMLKHLIDIARCKGISIAESKNLLQEELVRLGVGNPQDFKVEAIITASQRLQSG